MGWSSGSELAEVIEKVILKYVPKKDIFKATKPILESLKNMDWDCIEEVELFYYVDLLENKSDYSDFDDYQQEVKKLSKKFL